MRKFLSRRDRRRSVMVEQSSDDEPANASRNLESVREDSASVFGASSSSKISRRASVIADSFNFLKEDSETTGSGITMVSRSSTGGSDESPRKSKNILRTLSSRRSASSLYHRSHYTGSSSVGTLPEIESHHSDDQSLIDPDWDSETIKSGWVNLLTEDAPPKIYLAELKGSTLGLYKPSGSEMAHVSHFTTGQGPEGMDISATGASGVAVGASITQSARNRQQQQDLLRLQQMKLNMSTHSLADSLADKETLISSSAATSAAAAPEASATPKIGSVPDANSPATDPSNSTDAASTTESTSSTANITAAISDNDTVATAAAAADATPSVASANDNIAESVLEELKNAPTAISSLNDTILSPGTLHASIAQEKKYLPTVAEKTSVTKPVKPSHEFQISSLEYGSCVCPHPDLTFEESDGTILGGSIEAICHTITFYPSQEVADQLIHVLPLSIDINLPLAYFDLFLKSFVSVDDGEIAPTGCIAIPFESRRLMIKRISRFLKAIATQYVGMLLDDSILHNVWNVLLTLDNLTDCSDLKVLIHERQKSLRLLLQFEDHSKTITLSALNAQAFLTYPPETLAYEIRALDRRFNDVWNARTDKSLSLSRVHQCFDYWRKNFLVFDSYNDVHYLARLLAYHIFDEAGSDNALRARLLSHWVSVGDILYNKGDMAGWLGIATLVCSTPVLRLSDTWSLADKKAIDCVTRIWAPIIFEVQQHRDDSSYRVFAPAGLARKYSKKDVIPYFGSVNFDIDPPLHSDYVKEYCKHVQKSDYSLEKWDKFYNELEDSEELAPADPLNELPGKFDSHLSHMLKDAINFNIGNRPFKLEDAMQKSLQAEKVYSGKYYKHHDKSRSPLFLGSYASILFPKVLESYEIYDRGSLVGAIGGVDPAQNVLDSSANNLTSLMKSERNDITSKRSNRNTFLKHIRDVFNIDTYEFHENDDSIIFKTIVDPTELDPPRDLKRASKSRPSSILFGENSSVKRFSSYSTSSFNLDEYVANYHSYLKDVDTIDDPASPVLKDSPDPTDAARKRLSAQISRSVPILPEAATVDRLMDLLVLTSSIFSSRVREKDIKSYAGKLPTPGRSLSLKMDQGTFTITFFAVYRCFCSPLQLLEGLRKRFIGSKSCAVSIVEHGKDLNDFHFPEWTLPLDNYSFEDITWPHVLQIQLGVLESLLALFEYYYTHFLDDIVMRRFIDSFFELIDSDINGQWPSILNEIRSTTIYDSDYVKSINKNYKDLCDVYEQAKNAYIKNCYSPVLDPLALRISDESNEPIAKDLIPKWKATSDLSSFVMDIDATVSRLMNDITAEDWIDSFEMLEVLTAKSPLSLFNYDVQSADTSDSLLAISNIFHWISTLVDDESTETSFSFVVEKFPASVRAVLKYYFRLKNYFTQQLLDSDLSSKERQGVMASILTLISISRVKMRKVELFNPSDERPDISPRVPSLIESCLVNVVLSPESRFFGSDWIEASKLLGNSVESSSTLSAFLPDEDALAAKLGEYANTPLSPSPGWILQSLLEIACFVPNMYVKNTNLINFDKDRFAYNCVVNIMDLVPDSGKQSEKFSFLLSQAIPPVSLVDAYKLAQKSDAKSASIFARHLRDQRKLMKLEEAKYSLLSKQIVKSGQKPITATAVPGRNLSKPKSQSKNSETSTLALSRGLSHISLQSGSDKSSSPSKFKLSGFFGRKNGFWGGNNGSSREVIEMHSVPVSELPDANSAEHKSKAAQSLNLKETSLFPTYGEPFCFKVDFGNNGPERSLQATSELEKDDWMRRINYSRRHWFFSKSLNKSGMTSKMVFGVPLEYVCAREGSSIPNIIEKILSEIEYRGLEEVGIYRRSASLTAIQKIKDKINKMGDMNMEDQLLFDVHNLTGCVKSYLRELPDPLIPDNLLERFIKVKELSKDDRRFQVYRDIFRDLPPCNYALLNRLSRHLKLVVEYQDQNRMTSSNLATILGGSLIEGCDPENLRNYFGLMTFVCEDLILNYDNIFTKP